MPWNVVFLIGGIATLVLGVYSFTQRKQLFISILGIIWFAIVLFKWFIPDTYPSIYRRYFVIFRFTCFTGTGFFSAQAQIA